MSIITHNFDVVPKTTPTVALPVTLASDRRLKLVEIRVLIALYIIGGRNLYFQATRKEIAAKTGGYDYKTISQALTALHEKGYLERRLNNGGISNFRLINPKH
jgi:DNA-binding MarR family transcriptional regulator